jgi:hypothetical protein
MEKDTEKNREVKKTTPQKLLQLARKIKTIKVKKWKDQRWITLTSEMIRSIEQ